MRPNIVSRIRSLDQYPLAFLVVLSYLQLVSLLPPSTYRCPPFNIWSQYTTVIDSLFPPTLLSSISANRCDIRTAYAQFTTYSSLPTDSGAAGESCVKQVSTRCLHQPFQWRLVLHFIRVQTAGNRLHTVVCEIGIPLLQVLLQVRIPSRSALIRRTTGPAR